MLASARLSLCLHKDVFVRSQSAAAAEPAGMSLLPSALKDLLRREELNKFGQVQLTLAGVAGPGADLRDKDVRRAAVDEFVALVSDMPISKQSAHAFRCCAICSAANVIFLLLRSVHNTFCYFLFCFCL